MYTSEFTYKKASSVAEAIQLMQQHPDAKLLAGGHSLIPTMKLRLASPAALIDISKVAEMQGIRREGDNLVIGAMTTHHEIESSKLVQDTCPMLAATAAQIGDPAVRYKGTIGGSLAHSDPAADYPAVVLALNAKIKIVGAGGARVVDVDNFFQGMFDTAVQPGEILTEVHIAINNHKMAYVNFTHPASRYALTGVAVMAGPNWVRAAVTGATSHATRLIKLENALAGKPLTAENIKAACQNLVDASDLLGDHVASAEYRAHLVNVAAERALLKAAGLGGASRAMGGGADDITRIEGIGPKIGQALNAAGINTYAELASASQDRLKGILEKAGLPFAPSLETWAEQAGYLARGDEAGFKALTDKLTGGRRE